MNEKEVKGKKLFVGRAQKKNERREELARKYEQKRLERLNRYQVFSLPPPLSRFAVCFLPLSIGVMMTVHSSLIAAKLCERSELLAQCEPIHILVCKDDIRCDRPNPFFFFFFFPYLLCFPFKPKEKLMVNTYHFF